MILAFPVFLWRALNVYTAKVTALQGGFLWGLIVFGMHFHWLAQLLLQHANASCAFCLFLYGCLVVYGALTTAVWFLVMSMWRSLFFIPVFLAYWFWVDYFFLYPLGFGMGYPFINPLLSLVSYQPCRLLLWCIGVLMYGPTSQPLALPTVLHLPPVVSRAYHYDQPWRCNSDVVGHKLYRQLDRLAARLNAQPWSFVVAPESTFMFPLHKHQDLIHLWSSALPPSTHMMIGSIYKDERGGHYQAVYWLHGCLIINVYVKKMAVPIVETMPAQWRNSCLHNLFLKEGEGECRSMTKQLPGCVDYFDISAQVRVIPQICLEFYCNSGATIRRHLNYNTYNYVFLFLNDSWFNSFFCSLLYRLAVLKAQLIGVPVWYIGHDECRVIMPNIAPGPGAQC